jgi:hypothetical protein
LRANATSSVPRALLVMLGIVTVVSVCSCATAQELECPVVGDGVRIRYADLAADGASAKEVKGRVLEIDSTLITISNERRGNSEFASQTAPNSDALFIPVAGIRRIEVRMSGMPRLSYMVRGMGVGAGAGFILGVLASAQDDGGQLFSRVEVGMLLSVLFAPIGALVGGAVAAGEEYSPCDMRRESIREYSIEAVRNGAAIVVRF